MGLTEGEVDLRQMLFHGSIEGLVPQASTHRKARGLWQR
jgi:hypothetical protein